MNIKKNDIVSVTLTERAAMDKTLAEYDGHKLLVTGGYVGQNVNVRLTKMRERRWEGVMVSANSTVSGMITPPCENFGKCGGCATADCEYEYQLNMKKEYVQMLFARAGLDLGDFSGILPSPLQSRYRNKMEFSFGDQTRGGRLELGLHEAGHHYSIVPITDCVIAPKSFSIIVNALADYFRDKGETHFSRFNRQGLLRHLVLRKSFADNELLINLVTTPGGKLDEAEFVKLLTSLPLEERIGGILRSTNESVADVTTQQTMRVLYGNDHITETIGGLRFDISSGSFFQTNTLAAEVLYNKALEYAGELSGQTVFDLYCGTGTIAQLAARHARKVYGIEIVPEAAEAASAAARRNGLDNCDFLCADVAKAVSTLPERPDTIIIDPPRAGLTPKALAGVLAFAPKTIVYISCQPTSLLRDLPEFLKAGYTVEKSGCVDMFPATGHVETVVLMSKVK